MRLVRQQANLAQAMLQQPCCLAVLPDVLLQEELAKIRQQAAAETAAAAAAKAGSAAGKGKAGAKGAAAACRRSSQDIQVIADGSRA